MTGRPPKRPADRRRDGRVTVGLSEAERETLEAWAATRGVPVAEAVRGAAVAAARRVVRCSCGRALRLDCAPCADCLERAALGLARA